MSVLSRPLRWTLLALPLLLIAIGACQEAPVADPEPTLTPTPTATPTVAPTPTPTPMPAPIMPGPEETLREFFQSIPVEDQQCMVQALGQARLDQILEGAEQPTEEEVEVIFGQCMSQQTHARFLVGMFISEAGTGSLSDDTLGCIWSTLEEVDLTSLLTGGARNYVAAWEFGRIILCFSDEEVARTEAAAGPEGYPIVEARCFYERVTLEDLDSLFTGDMGGTPSPEILAAMDESDFEMFGEGEAPPFTPEQFACLEDALGDETLAEVMGGERVPAADELDAAVGCGIEMGGPEGEVPPFTLEQLACLEDALGDEAMTEVMGGEREPTADELDAAVGCGIEMGGLEGEVPPFTLEQLACLEDALGDETLAEVMGGEREPTADELDAAVGCGIDIH